MKYLYEYPQDYYPYNGLVDTNRRRSRSEEQGAARHRGSGILAARIRQADLEFRLVGQPQGPLWMPVNLLIIRALLHYYSYYGDNFMIDCPTGSGNSMNLFEIAREIANRLIRIFPRGETGRRPVFGVAEKFQSDPHWQDHLLFYEYFHGDNGAGIGASHQTGWTGAVAALIQLFGRIEAS